MAISSPLACSDRRPQDVARAEPSSVALTEVSWFARRELATRDWLRQGRWLGVLGRASAWWIGDWVRYGNARYGERYALAAKVTGYDVHSLMNMAYVASHFEVSRRRENLSFSHHAELACLPRDEQERWLDRAERECLSVRHLRGALRREATLPRGRPPAGGSQSRRSTGLPADAAAGADPAAAATQTVCPHCGHHFRPRTNQPVA